MVDLMMLWFDFWCMTPLSAIFQLYHGDQLLVVVISYFRVHPRLLVVVISYFRVHSRLLVAFASCCSIFGFCVVFCRSLFVLCLLAIVLYQFDYVRGFGNPRCNFVFFLSIVLSILLWFTCVDYPSGIFWLPVWYLMITPLVSSDYPSGIFWLPVWFLLITRPISSD